MSVRRRLALSTAVLACAAGAPSAWAQSAGDEQYSDPLAGTSTSQRTTSSPSLTPAPSSTASTPATTPAPSSAAAGTASATPTAPAASASASGAAELPRTGADTGLLFALGCLVLLAGVGLRLRTGDARG